jgi:hypothetical protein
MVRVMAWTALALAVAVSAAPFAPATLDESSIATVLDDWHKAASAADEQRYFAHFAADAVMMGTDATERWTRDEFRQWAKPHFERGKAWSFKAAKRFVTLSPDGSVAWFDETLETAELGPCRGSGVLVRQGNRWLIAQYNLSVPIPNEAFKEVKKVIDAALAAKRD